MEMESPRITNRDVIDRCESDGKTTTIEWVMSKCDNADKPSDRAFGHAVMRVLDKKKNLRKNIKKDGGMDIYNKFCDEIFIMPLKSLVSRNASDARLGLDGTEHAGHLLAAMELGTELAQSNDRICEMEIQQAATKERHASEMQASKMAMESIEAKLVEKTKALKRTAKREEYHRERKVNKASSTALTEPTERERELTCLLVEKDRQIKQLTTETQELRTSVDWLQNLIQDNEDFDLFDESSKRYSAELKQCVFELLTNNVSCGKVASVIESVLRLAGRRANKLPGRTSIMEMNIQRLVLAQKQLAEVFAKQEDTTLITDETSKFGAAYMGYEASDSDGNTWVLGLRHIETKSADNTLKVFKELLSDIDERSHVAQNGVSRDILQHITATMSDRAATESKFNDILQEYRKSVLPMTYAHYDEFSPAERASLETLCNFFCGLHALVNFATATQAAVTEAEKGLFDGEPPIFQSSFRKVSEPGSCRLVRTASKAFAAGGDDKSGCFGPFRRYVTPFLKQKKLYSVPLVPYRGSRFNILFENAACVFFLAEQMTSFLEGYGTHNQLLKAVLHDLKTREYLAGVKALGLISRLVTSPLWLVLEDKSVHILDMNVYYADLTNFFADVTQNLGDFMSGDLLPFGTKTKVQSDVITESLLQPSEFDATVETVLGVVFPALAVLSQRLFRDHLPGGKYDGAGPAIWQKTKSSPKTSKFAESVFGSLDQLLRCKPNLSIIAGEAYIMFANNKTLQWLQSKDSGDRARLLTEASKERKAVHIAFKARQRAIEDSQRATVEAKIRKQEAATQQRLKLQQQYTANIIHYGLWQTPDEVDNMLASYPSNAQQIKAMTAQIQFRRDVLNQKPSQRSLFSKTKKDSATTKRTNLSVPELAYNLKELVKESAVEDQQSGEARHLLVGKRVKHRFVSKDTSGHDVITWFFGKIISQVKWKLKLHFIVVSCGFLTGN